MVFESLRFYTVSEVADRLRVSEDFILELVVQGVLEGINLGNRGVWIFEERAILEFLCECSNSIGKSSDLHQVLVSKGEEVISKGERVVVSNLDDGKVVSDLGEGHIPVLRSYAMRNGKDSSVGSSDEDVITEFIFDEEQAKKPISDEIVFSCDLGEEERGESKKQVMGNDVCRRVKRNFVISEFLVYELKKARDVLGGSMSSIVEDALGLYFQSKGFISEHNFKR
ncbi:helix-turn-helix domain-containing protein [Clostridium tarantellae]|uniref:Helix-turn-helix domain-containing protein n=1 Tax=Clostridium tarantellae TaxID=39493 RepID=A0A6I1MIV4_9CLOT|nr:helix-turn-helix domain-containing protein [Clostridium tarantellae]MPQ42623.1 helix-turn-helix domain-containing protein [Clostridium tarantellae]